MVVLIVGGIGLFLLGMLLLTDGLKTFAGDSLRRALLRFTGRPAAAFGSGLAVTALVQSSSATTLATIGFVSAGLITFPQAIGVLFGASLGTSSTGWLVSTLGLKFSVSTLALPLVAGGALLGLSKRGRWSALGLSVAGFGLIFIGIDTLQQGMEGLAARVDPSDLPGAGIGGKLALMLIGILMTVLMQSSSAAVVTTMAALYSGAVDFEQATTLVIGQAVGTTSTALLAAIGASVPARRTAAAHVVFNLSTALVALALQPLFLSGIAYAQSHFGLDPGAVSLAAFHTSFIALGVVLFLPMTNGFARFIEWIIPERDARAVRHLDDSVLSVPSVALEALRGAVRNVAAEAAGLLAHKLEPGADPVAQAQLQSKLEEMVLECEQFLARIPPVDAESRPGSLRLSLLHALDHLGRMLGAFKRTPRLPKPDCVIEEYDRLYALSSEVALSLKLAFEANPSELQHLSSIPDSAKQVAALRKQHRAKLLEDSVRAKRTPGETLAWLDAVRWIDTATYHCWRLARYLGEGETQPSENEADNHR